MKNIYFIPLYIRKIYNFLKMIEYLFYFPKNFQHTSNHVVILNENNIVNIFHLILQKQFFILNCSLTIL